MFLKQSTAVELKLGPFLDSGDGVTTETALTISQADVRLAKNDGDWAQKNESTAAAHEENGWYRVLLDTTDTNTLGRLTVAVNESGALPVWKDYMVVPSNVWDSLFGSDKLDVNVAEWLGTAPATPKTAGVPIVDDRAVTHTGTAQSGSATTIQLDTGASATNNQYLGQFITIGSGTGAGQTRLVIGYVGATRNATIVGNWATNPDNTSVFTVWGSGISDIRAWMGVAPNALQDGRVDSYLGAVAAGVLAAASFAANALDAVWSAATRTLTSGANIALAKGTGVTGFNDLDAAGVRGAVGLAAADLDTQLAALPTAGENADAVWDELIADHQTAGSTGEALTDAGSAGDPWTTALPGAYGAGTAGNIIGNRVDAAISTRATPAQVNSEVDTALADYDGPTHAELVSEVNAVQSDIAALNNLSAAQVNAEVDTALADVGLTTTITGRIDAAISSRLATAGYTAPDNATISAISAAVITELAEILADTNELQTDLANGGRLDLLIDAIKAKTDGLPASPAAVSDIPTAIQNADALLDRADGIETDLTFRQWARGVWASTCGKASGALTATMRFRNKADTKDVLTVAVDGDGNRTSVTTDLT